MRALRRSVALVVFTAAIFRCPATYAQEDLPEMPVIPTDITGILVNEEGKPIEGVELGVYTGSYADPDQPAIKSLTDAKGAFAAHVEAKSYEVSFRHPKEKDWLSARTQACHKQIQNAWGGPLDLGTLVLRWYGIRIHVKTTCEGKPVPGVAISTGPTRKERKAVTDSEGAADFTLDQGKGDSFALFADDDLQYSGVYCGIVGEPGSEISIEIPLVRGRSKIDCTIVDCMGSPLSRITRVYVAPEEAEKVDENSCRFEKFKYAMAFASAETDEHSHAIISHLPPGRYHVAAVVEGLRLYPGGVPGTTVKVGPWETASVELKSPGRHGREAKEPKGVVSIGGNLTDMNMADVKIRDWIKLIRAAGSKDPMNLGVYFIPKNAKGDYFLFPAIPNAVVDIETEDEYFIRDLPCVEPMIWLVGGVSENTAKSARPEAWALSHRVFPIGVDDVVHFTPNNPDQLCGGVLSLTAEKYAKHYDWPVAIAERFFAWNKMEIDRRRESEKRRGDGGKKK